MTSEEDSDTPVGRPRQAHESSTFFVKKKRLAGVVGNETNREEEVDGESRERDVEERQVEETSVLPSLSQENEWKACLSACFYISSSPAASLWLLP